jgi:CPA1 family monovalent cation:H+ antiporter
MPEVETLFLLTAAVTALVLLARRLEQPYPILLVLGGLLLGFVPGLPRVDLQPEAVFLVFLPPLLFVDALNTSWRDFKYNLRPILLLAVGLVLVTIVAVAAVAHALIPRLTWPAAFVLGAVVAPTDAVATSAIAERLRIPRRIVTVLQGESLVNDATAIVAYRIALAAAMGDGFSLGHAAGRFLLVAAGGVAVGLTIGYGVGWIRRHLPQDPPVENTVSLLTPLTAYLPADWLHVSGVLSVVACGIYLGRMGPHVVSSRTRLQAIAMWQMISFLLDGLLFLLVGLQLRHIVNELPAGRPVGALILTTLLIGLTVVVVRLVWTFPTAYLPRLLSPSLRRRDPYPSWRHVALVAWSGMRGGVSLAVALSIPVTLGDGPLATHFPARNALIFITFGVILITLVAQGLSLPPLIRALGVVAGQEEHVEELRARSHVNRAAMERLNDLVDGGDIPSNIHEEIRRYYTKRDRKLNASLRAHRDGDAAEEGAPPEEAEATPSWDAATYLRLKHDLLNAERATVIALRDRGEISDEVMRRIQNDLDLDESRLGSLEGQHS